MPQCPSKRGLMCAGSSGRAAGDSRADRSGRRRGSWPPASRHPGDASSFSDNTLTIAPPVRTRQGQAGSDSRLPRVTCTRSRRPSRPARPTCPTSRSDDPRCPEREKAHATSSKVPASRAGAPPGGALAVAHAAGSVGGEAIMPQVSRGWDSPLRWHRPRGSRSGDRTRTSSPDTAREGAHRMWTREVGALVIVNRRGAPIGARPTGTSREDVARRRPARWRGDPDRPETRRDPGGRRRPRRVGAPEPRGVRRLPSEPGGQA